jgi:hypothetical protein
MKKSINKTLAVAIGGIVLGGISASAGPIATTTYGGDTFELFDNNGISWSTAEANAVADGGTLAVLTSTAQIEAVYNGLINNGFFQGGGSGSQDVEAWLGATPADGSSSTLSANNWEWVTGAAWTVDDAENFAAGEPNGDSDGLAINRYGTFTFNDEGGHVGGYIVELGRDGNVGTVPDASSTLPLFGMSLAGLAAFARRFKK